MKLYVNEKLFSIHRKFYVKNEYDVDEYEISSKPFSLGHKTTILDMQGNKVAYIEQEIFHLTPHYNVYIKDELAFKLSRELKLFKRSYVLSNGYRVEGNLFMLDFVIFDEKNVEIGSIKRKFISIGDKYEISIEDTSKKEIVLAIVVAITHDVNTRQNSND